MQWQNSSRTASKRNKRVRILLYTVLFLVLQILPAAALHAAHTRLDISPTDRGLYIDLDFHSGESGRILRSLQAGMSSRIFFQIRVYEHKEGLADIFGGRLVMEAEPKHILRFDPFLESYLIERSYGKTLHFAAPAPAISAFLRLEDYPIPLYAGENRRRREVRTRIILEPIRLIPPLHILSLILPFTDIRGEWQRGYIDRQEAGEIGLK
ncbi:MAG: DUF4390 domain-containing protein [Spirochaetales bacterium]|nr:DUF4390 domain-containing protein [Spirochaetales bacterium]MCF7939256.1 DUF4390 domain-containing protein [Spirochaetales bacterium]